MHKKKAKFKVRKGENFVDLVDLVDEVDLVDVVTKWT
jgi:hypothetical protein